MRPDLVIFDCDGVVVDSEILTNSFLRDEMAAYGLDLPLGHIMGLFVGGTIAGAAERARSLGAALPPDWVDSFYSRLCDRLAEGTPMIPGIVAVLERLDAAPLPYCIASNGRHAKMQVTLGQHPGLAARFDTNVFAAQDVARPKPAPDLFLHAARRMGHPPEDCIVIEDSATGAKAARAAGMRCLGYVPEGDGAALRAEGADLFHAMADLPGLLHL